MNGGLIDGPGSATSVKWENLHRRLLLIKPLSLKENVQTMHGVKDCIMADIHVLPEHGAMQSLPGEVLRNAAVFPGVIQGQIRDNIGNGRFNLGRLTQGVAVKGNPPWMLAEPTEAELKAAEEYLATQGTQSAQRPAQAPGNTTFSGGSEPPF